jgi:hypothetical protein
VRGKARQKKGVSLPSFLKFRHVDFYRGRKTGEPGEKPSNKGENQQTTQSLGIEPIMPPRTLINNAAKNPS